MAQVTGNTVKPGPMNMPNMSVYNPYASPAASALSSRSGTITADQRSAAGLSPMLTPATGSVSQIKPASSPLQTPQAQPYAAAPASGAPVSSVAQQLENIKQQALKIQSAIPGSAAGAALQAPVQPQTSATGATGASQPPSYSGLVGSLASTATHTPDATAAAQTGLLGTGATNPGTSGQAYTDYQNSVNELNTLKQNIAKNYAGNSMDNVPLDVQTGRAQVMQQQYADQLDAAQQKVNEKQAAITNQIQGTQTQQTGLNEAGSLGLTGQSQTMSGLNSAASLAKPEPTAQGQTTYSPLTNSFSGGSYQNNLQTVVDSIKSGNVGYTDGVNSLSSLSPTAKADVLAALGPGFDTVKSDAAASARGSSITTLGTNAANITASQQQQIANYKSAQQQGQNLASQAKDLITTFGLNPSELNAANGAIQKIAQNTSNPQYQILSNYLNDISARYSQVLTPPGGSSTDTTRAVATGMLNALASGNSIKTVLDSLDQQATAVISGIPATGTVPGGGTGGSSDLNSSSAWPGFN